LAGCKQVRTNERAVNDDLAATRHRFGDVEHLGPADCIEGAGNASRGNLGQALPVRFFERRDHGRRAGCQQDIAFRAGECDGDR